MAQNSGGNPILQLIISAKDDASKIISQVFGALNNSANVVAGQVRDTFSSLFGGGLDSAIEFEAQLDKVQAKGSYTAETMDTLKQAAIDLGAKFGITGMESAQGMESLAAAGLDATQVMEALPSVLALAKVENLSLDEASAKLANSLTTVGLGFDQAARLADVLTQAANESTTSASAVAAALETAGGIATTAGMTFEQTAAALTVLAKGGIEGSKAGTALQAILTQLLNPASTASQALNALGITSRDLGTVISELEKRGSGANAAILAFGETAGPALRSMIGQGSQSLTDMEQSMLKAGGAALKASDQMGGNLKSALEGLSGAWDSLKTALFDPVLEPLTTAANEFSTALNTNLKDGALKPTQDAIKSFAENGIVALKDFFASFDTSEVGPRLQQFAADAKTAFDSMASGGKAAADVIVLTWNGISLAIKSVMAVITGVTAVVATSVESVAVVMNKIGLISDNVAIKVSAFAEASRNEVARLRDGIVEDAGDMSGAYDRLTDSTTKTATEQKKLGAALPVAETKELTKTLADYQRIADEANAATAKAKADYEAGKISGADYAKAIQNASEANHALDEATQAQTKSTKTSGTAAEDAAKQQTRLAVELQARQKQEEDLLALAGKLVSAHQATAAATVNEAEAALALAKAKGDEFAIRDANLALQKAEVTEAQAAVRTQQAELQNLELKRKQLIETAGGIEKLTAAQRLELAAIESKIEAQGREIVAGEQSITLQQRQAQEAELAAGPLGDQVVRTEKQATATERVNAQLEQEIANRLALKQQAVTEEQQKLSLLEADQDLLQVGQQTLTAELEAAEAAKDTNKVNELKLAIADNLIAQAQKEVEIAKQKVIVAQELVKMSKAEAEAALEKAAAYEKAVREQENLLRATIAQAEAEDGIDENERKAIALIQAKIAGLKGEVIAQNAAADAAQASIKQGEKQVEIAGATVKAMEARVEVAEANKKTLQDEIDAQEADAEAKKDNTEATKDNTDAAKDNASSKGSSTKNTNANADAAKKSTEATKQETVAAKDNTQATDDQSRALADNTAEQEKNAEAATERAQAVREAVLTLQGLQADFLSLQGQDYAADLLQQQVDYASQLLSLQNERLEAEKAGNTELVRILDAQAALMAKINGEKVAAIDQQYLADIIAVEQEIIDVTQAAADEKKAIEQQYWTDRQAISAEADAAILEGQRQANRDITAAGVERNQALIAQSAEYTATVKEELTAVADALADADRDYAQGVIDLTEQTADAIADINATAEASISEFLEEVATRQQDALTTLADQNETLKRSLLTTQGETGAVIAAEFGDQLDALIQQAAQSGEEGQALLQEAVNNALQLQNLQLDADRDAGTLSAEQYQKAKDAIDERLKGLDAVLAAEQAIIAAQDEATRAQIEADRQAALAVQAEDAALKQRQLDDELAAEKAAIASASVERRAALDADHQAQLVAIRAEYDAEKAAIQDTLADSLAAIAEEKQASLADIQAEKTEQLAALNEELTLSKAQLAIDLERVQALGDTLAAQKLLNQATQETVKLMDTMTASFNTLHNLSNSAQINMEQVERRAAGIQKFTESAVNSTERLLVDLETAQKRSIK